MDIRADRARSHVRVHPVLVTAVVAFVGWLLLATFAVALGFVVTNFVVGHMLGHGDIDVARWFAEGRTDTWNTLSSVGSYVAETVTVLVIIGIALVVLGVRRAWPQFALLSVAMACEAATYLVATYFVSRNRPPVPRLESLIQSDSFPSGHTAASVALYGSLCIIVWSLTDNRAWRVLFLLVAVLAPIVVGASRMYRGMHFATDVVSGFLIGSGCIAVGYVAARAGLAAAEQRHDDRDDEDDEVARLTLVQEVAS
jgi:undecaprenyl-diphosphatase